MAKILVVEDDHILGKMLVSWLEREHHTVEFAENGSLAMDLIFVADFDFIVMDWELPGANGVDIIAKYRARGGKAPVLMLTAKGTIEDKEVGFSVGTDDYLTKPFHPKEFDFRVKALLRRATESRSDVLQLADLVVDTNQHQAKAGSQVIELAPIEFKLLEFLMRNQGSVFNVEALMSRVWTSDASCSVDSVRMCVARLRAKLKRHPNCPTIETLHGAGYKLTQVTVESQ